MRSYITVALLKVRMARQTEVGGLRREMMAASERVRGKMEARYEEEERRGHVCLNNLKRHGCVLKKSRRV